VRWLLGHTLHLGALLGAAGAGIPHFNEYGFACYSDLFIVLLQSAKLTRIAEKFN
jgi:hypothetical protein